MRDGPALHLAAPEPVTRRRRSQTRVGALAQVRDALGVLDGDWKPLLALAGIGLVAGLVETAALYCVARMATALANGADHVAIDVGFLSTSVSTGRLAGIGSILVLLLLAVSFPAARSSARVSALALERRRARFTRAYLAAPWADRSRDAEGHFQLYAGDYCLRAERLVFQVGTLAVTGGMLCVLVVASVVIAPIPAALAVLGLGVLATAFRPLARRGKRGSIGMAAIDKRFSSLAAQSSRVSQEVATFDVEDAVIRQLGDEAAQGALHLRRVRFHQRLVPLVYQCGALLVVLAILAVLSTGDSSDVASLAPVLLLLLRGLGYAKQLQNSVQAGNEFITYVEALDHEEQRLVVPDRRIPTARPTELGTVRFEQVGFEYEPGVTVLCGVDLEIAPGDSLALVGPSGAGKSTLLQLLLRLRMPTEGRVAVDGTDLREIDGSAWSRLVAFVPQQNRLILGTVRENIAFYRAGYTDEQIVAAAASAHILEEIEALPNGLDTLVGPGASDLSGGQCQRIGIARALLGEPAMLVLDEPTSALDRRSERLIRTTLAEMADAVSLVVVAHRQTTVKVCRRVVRVEHGRIREVIPGSRAATG